MTVLKAKRKVYVRRRPPEARAFLAEAVARRRQMPTRVETPNLVAALIARGRRKESDPR
jgi:hypothetical protein